MAQITTRSAPKRSKLLLIIGFILLLASLPFILIGKHMLETEQRYEKEGVIVSGVVLNRTTETTRDRKSTSTSYYLAYKFSVKNGEELQGKGTVSEKRWSSIRENDSIEVQYLASDPSKNRVAQESEFVAGWVFIGFGGLTALIAIFVLWFDIKKRRIVKWLAQNGLATEATVTEVAPGNLTINNVQQWRIQYSFKDFRGREFEGRSEHMAPQIANAWKKGDKGKVRYDKQNPATHMWVQE